MLVRRKPLLVMLLVVVLAVPTIGPPALMPAQAAQMCSLVDWSGTYEADNGNGAGTRSYFEAGTVLHYYVSNDSSDGGMGFDIYSGDFADAPGDVFHRDAPAPGSIQGTFTIPKDGTYAVGGGIGGPVPGNGTIRIEYECGVTLICNAVGSFSGPNNEGNGVCFWAEQGDTLTIIGHHAEGGEFGGGIHGPGGWDNNFGGWGGVGSSQTTVIIPTDGTYCVGLDFESHPDDTAIVTMKAYLGCVPSSGGSDAPGPDMVPIPPYAVVGTFVTTTVALFAPDAAAVTEHEIQAGTSVWVYGMDESGQFYYVMMSGQFFWVPAATLGPNYDDVWQGAPLPTNVVG
jgi:hypothetical protein